MVMKRALIILVGLGIVGGAIYHFATRRPSEYVLTGIVTTDDVIVSPQIQGRLEKLNVKQGDTVKRGDLLAVIQPEQWQADMRYFTSGEQQATTQVTQAEADL